MNIIVTGCSKGIGLELVRSFCKDVNNTVIGISRSEISQLLIAEMGKKSFFYPISYDLGNINYELKDMIISKMSKVDILINNAGFLVKKPFEQLNDIDFDSMFNINVKAVFKIVQLLLPVFAENAHIVNISSMGGFQGSAKFKGLSLYSASKGALNTLTECLAEELKDYNIKVNSLSLGAVNTEMMRTAFPGYQAPIQPCEMADFVKEFAENASRYLNGKIIPVSITTP